MCIPIYSDHSGRIGQSRRMSAVEAMAGTAIGYIVAVATQMAVFPVFGPQAGVIENPGMGLAFTAVSLVRSYLVRCLFARLHGRGAAPGDGMRALPC
jgi:hypothetical protein